MLQCPKCGRSFATDVTVCPDDGTPLSADSTVVDETPLDPLIGHVLDDKYRLDARMGEGGMGTVYRATHLLIERPVAVKVLNSRLVTDEAAKERFRREARAAGRLQHTNAVAVTDFGETRDGLVYIVMELLEGRPLRDILAHEAPLDAARAVSLMLQISAAVEAAHEAGIIHRDLKPGNIFLVQRHDAPYIVKVLDFGIAKLAGGEEGNPVDTLTGTGVMIGTPRYMSPEQCDGAQLTPASDVYSLGVIFYEMLTGQTPFTGTTPLALALQHSSETPRPLRETVPAVPPALEAITLHALEKSPGDRPNDAGEFRRELFSAAERLGLEHAGGFSAPTIETLRDAGTETPSGRLIIDIERLRRNRANLTGEAGATTDEKPLRDTSGRPLAASSVAASNVGDESARAASSNPSVSSAASSSTSQRAESHVDAARARAQSGPRGLAWKRWLTQPPILVAAICVGLLLVFGAVLLLRPPAQSSSALPAQADESEDALGRTLSAAGAAPRGAMVQQPRNAAEFYENGTYFLSIRSYDAAIRDLRRAVELQPDFPSAHNRLGRALMFKGQFPAAVEEFRKAVEQRGGNFPTAQYNLGFALQQLGNNEKAVAAYRDAIKSRSGDYPDAYYQIGSILLNTPDGAKDAADAFGKAIEQNKGRDPDSLHSLGVALVRQKNYTGAEAAFREAVNQRGGDFAYAHYNLGLLYQQTERPAEAIKEFETYLQQAPRNESRDNRARVENTLRDLRRQIKREGGGQTNEGNRQQ
ncbi:MAG TPA: serine/threonine-protein kinase [Pyrinomonadaceae bacterium]|nr:serine/threonine-protein kinase [Pyrinomonadaceae bacterium]